MSGLSDEPVFDVRALPDYAFGHRMPIWWGTVFFMIIEGSALLMLVAAYLYLFSQNTDWPPVGRLPDPTAGAVLALVLIASELPNTWVKRVFKRFDVTRARLGLLLMSSLGLCCLLVRAWEFHILELHWSTNAFASMIWALLVTHTLHLAVDVVETCIMAAASFLAPLDGRRFVDFVENAEYWDFVVVTWLPVYGAMYWLPRWMAG